MSHELTKAVLAALPAKVPLPCPECGTQLISKFSHRTGLWRANHPASDCRYSMGTWGYALTESALMPIVKDAPRMAEESAVAKVCEWIAAGMMISDRKRREEG